MKTVKVLTVDLDTTKAKVKLDDIEAQLDRILDKQKQLGIFGKSVFIGSSGEELNKVAPLCNEELREVIKFNREY